MTRKRKLKEQEWTRRVLENWKENGVDAGRITVGVIGAEKIVAVGPFGSNVMFGTAKEVKDNG